MITLRINTKGMINIPERLRKKYSFTPGTRLRFEETEKEIIITSLFTKKEIKVNAGCLGLNGKMLRSLMEEKKIEMLL